MFDAWQLHFFTQPEAAHANMIIDKSNQRRPLQGQLAEQPLNHVVEISCCGIGAALN